MSIFESFLSKYLPVTISFFLIVAVILSLSFGFGNKKAESAWYSVGGTWSYRKLIVVNHAKVATTSSLTNFPMLFSVTDPHLKYTSFGGKVASTTGGDILFTSSDGSTKLDFEIERYASTTGELVAWVEVPTLSGVTDTNLFIYFGNSSASTNQQNPAGVWDSNYKGVWHLASTSVDTLVTTDSTSNGYTMSNNGTTPAIEAKVGSGASFNGSSQFLSNTSNPSTANSITVSFWNLVNTADVQNSGAFSFGNGAGTATNRALVHAPWSDSTVYWDFGNATDGQGRVSQEYTFSGLNRWAYITLVFDDATDYHAVYIDGVLKDSHTNSSMPTTLNGLVIGQFDAGATYYHKGKVDEFRYSNIARGSDWIATEYNNQSTPGSFYSYGDLNTEYRTVSSVKQNYKGTNSAGTPQVKIKGGVKFK